MPLTRKNTASSGQEAEAIALNHLKLQGLELLTRNYQCKTGEIDLEMKDGQCIVFVEVRLRNHKRFASGLETVDFRKQQKIIRTALHFLQKNKLLDASPCRFDIVSLRQGCAVSIPANAVQTNTDQFELDWIKDAFQIS